MSIIDEAIAKSKEMVTQNQTDGIKNFISKINQFNSRAYKFGGVAALSLMVGLTSLVVANSAGKSVSIYKQAASLTGGVYVSADSDGADGSTDDSSSRTKVTTATSDTRTEDETTTPPPSEEEECERFVRCSIKRARGFLAHAMEREIEAEVEVEVVVE